MKIAILTEDQAKFNSRFLAEHGLSVFIESDRSILLDVGQSDVYLKNAKKLCIDLGGCCVVLSHGHFDHTNGLRFLNEGTKVVAHPECFERKYYGEEYIGSPFSLKKMQDKFEVTTSKEPLRISENIFFLGEVPRETDFEGKTPVGHVLRDGEKHDDFVPDDSAVAIKTERGTVIVTGCSHSGICNIISHARKVTKENRVLAVIGGFHLSRKNETQIERTINWLRRQNIANLFPCHCMDLWAFGRFAEELGSRKVSSGDVLSF